MHCVRVILLLIVFGINNTSYAQDVFSRGERQLTEKEKKEKMKRYERWKKQYEKRMPIKNGDSPMSASCEEAQNIARADIAKDSLRYLEASQFFHSKKQIIEAYILYKQFHITPIDVPISCIRSSNPNENEHYSCYNNTIDSFISAKYNIDFRKVLQQGIDSMSKKVTAEQLNKKFMCNVLDD